VEPDDVRFLVQQKLTPLGLMVMPDGKAPQVQKLDPLLALKFRAAVVPKGLVRAVTTVFRPLFFPLLMGAVLAALIAFDYWLFGVHGVAQGLRASLYQPALLLLVLGCVVLSAAFHEIGHATACRYGGAEPGVMGVGIYVVWPALYTDVTDAYRLGKGGRLRTDVGGLYFNAIAVLSIAAVYFFLGGFEALLLIAVILQLQMIPQLMPFLRMDGYYMVADFTGVPDLFTRLKSILLSLIPWRKTDDRVKELKPWVRLAVTLWVLMVVPLLLFNLAVVVISAPRIFATAWDSFFVHWGKVSTAFGAGRVSAGLLGSIQMGALVLPAAGITYSAVRLGKRAATGAWKWSADSQLRRGAAIFGLAAVVGLLAYVWWPNGDYRPIQPGERWTAGQLVSAVKDVASGRPALSLQQQARTVVPAPRTSLQPTPGASPAPQASPTSGTSGSTGSSPTPSPGAEPSPTSSPSPSPSPSP
jgi:putative peptide zinc metalloprotease protein